MKINATSLNKKICATEMVGKLVLTAQNEVDAVQLAALARDWANLDGGSNRITQYRKEVLNKYCKENNVVIHIEE